jgi:hypothetical protein
VLNSTLPAEELDRRYRRLATGEFSLVYVAPERLRQGSLTRALAGRTQAAIVAEIDGLRQEGLLVVSESGGRPCLVLTDAGRAALAS